MPNKPPRNKQAVRNKDTPRSAASLLQRMSAQRGLNIPSKQELAAPEGARERLRNLLPELLALHLLEVRERPGEMVLFTDSAVWAGRLKLAVAALPAPAGDPRIMVRVMPRGGFRR
jgi:hypothetical protein